MITLNSLSYLPWNQMLRIHIPTRHYICYVHLGLHMCTWAQLSVVGSLGWAYWIPKLYLLEWLKPWPVPSPSILRFQTQSHPVLFVWIICICWWYPYCNFQVFYKDLYIQFLHVCAWICNHCLKLHISQCTVESPLILDLNSIPHFIQRHST